MAEIVTALQRLRNLWALGHYLQALALAAKWHDLGDAVTRNAIRTGHAAATNPRLYREMKKDPAELVLDGLAALAKRYNLTQGDYSALL
jgi:hypothetical protein